MRAVLQRVLNASVLVDGCQVSSINQGLCILLGIAQDDTSDDLDYMVRKILNVKVFNNEAGDNMWARSVKDAGLEILCVSQFTLYGSVEKNKPAFHRAMKNAQAKDTYETFLERLKQAYVPERIKEKRLANHYLIIDKTGFYKVFGDCNYLTYPIPNSICVDGVFGAMMVVNIANDGPVTLELDSRKFTYIDKPSTKGGSESSTSSSVAKRDKKSKADDNQNSSAQT
ncbi:7792_t:CDS:2 [Paraglomus occultum]|uniref:D-aminoacyl-tRNA deacylase n=1 Tax=Paraglomus occultum TaxID=144539 RepID=A0A9N9FF10_9GLOM|nr:7792_t:CDS:2 [Paraglomus occultum]